MNMEFVSINNIANDLYSHPLLKDLPFERIVMDTLELIQIVGCPNVFETKEVDLDVHDWKTLLPCDYYQINQLILLEPNNGFRVFKQSTDTFSLEGSEARRDLQYKIQGRILYTTKKECCVRMSYESIKLDEDGFPMIINNASFIRALKSYIKMNWFTVLFESSQLRADILQNAQQEYYANVAQAQNDLIMPDLAQMENISRIMNDAMTRQYEFHNTFRDLNKSHKIRIH